MCRRADLSIEYFPSDVPEGRSGDWEVRRFELPERECGPEEAERPGWLRYRPGRYTALEQGTTVFMTDLYDEWWTQREAMAQGLHRGGEVLVTGLGLGLVIESLLRPLGSRVERVTVLERSPDVIGLVGPHLEARHGARLRIREADAFDGPPPGRYSVVWHDIWPNPHAPGIAPEVEALERLYAPCCDWQGSWLRQYWEAERSCVAEGSDESAGRSSGA